MPCTNPIKIKNPRKVFDSRFDKRIIEVPCGSCLECRKRYANDWRIRLLDEIKYSPNSYNYFITMSIDAEHYDQFKDNPRLAIRRFNERYRKKFKVSCRHWIITELGDHTQRLHFHGILFNCKLRFDPIKPWINHQNLDYTFHELRDMWKYGHVFVGWCTGATASYIVKYVSKPQYIDGEFYKPKVFSSPGIGERYVNDPIMRNYHRSLPDGYYIIKRGGFSYALPRYYKQKLWSKNELRLTFIRHANDLKLYRLKGRTYPNDSLGYYQYLLNLSYLHQFNLSIYDPSTRKGLPGVQRCKTSNSYGFAKRSALNDSSLYNFE